MVLVINDKVKGIADPIIYFDIMVLSRTHSPNKPGVCKHRNDDLKDLHCEGRLLPMQLFSDKY